MSFVRRGLLFYAQLSWLIDRFRKMLYISSLPFIYSLKGILGNLFGSSSCQWYFSKWCCTTSSSWIPKVKTYFDCGNGVSFFHQSSFLFIFHRLIVDWWHLKIDFSGCNSSWKIFNWKFPHIGIQNFNLVQMRSSVSRVEVLRYVFFGCNISVSWFFRLIWSQDERVEFPLVFYGHQTVVSKCLTKYK